MQVMRGTERQAREVGDAKEQRPLWWFPWSEIVVEDKLVELSIESKKRQQYYRFLYRVIIIDDIMIFFIS